MNTYTPFDGIAQDYTANYELLTHTLQGQPTLYLVGINKGYTNEILPLPYHPSDAHGVGVAFYEHEGLQIGETFYAFTWFIDALQFAEDLGHQVALGILYDDGTIGIARIIPPVEA